MNVFFFFLLGTLRRIVLALDGLSRLLAIFRVLLAPHGIIPTDRLTRPDRLMHL